MTLWEPATHAFPAADPDAFLAWAADAGASDISFQTGQPAWIEVDGALCRASGATLDGPALQTLVNRLFNVTADGILRSGRAIDCSYTVPVPGTRRGRRRFRVNIAPVQVSHEFGVNVTLRVLPDAVPTLDELGIEGGIVERLERCRGLTLVTGVPGSGKSTLLAAGTRRLLERGAGRIQSYEAPIEFVFDSIATEAAMMSQSEIPRHFESFADGLRSSLRRRPAAVIVGEARDRETVDAVIRAADTGIAVFSTAHTFGVAATIRRLLAEFPEAERAERGAALIDVMNLVVTQVLLARPGGGRTAVREWLGFGADLKARLLEAPQQDWAALIAAALVAEGQDFRASLEAARNADEISEADCRRYQAAAG